MKIGIIKENKIPTDSRVVLRPEHCAILQSQGVDIVVQRSDVRCFDDAEYEKAGIPLADEMSDCDILLGVKEVPVEDLIPEKTYFFFSHTIKAQPYNRKLLQAVLQKKIRLIDYEVLTDGQGKRLIAFGVFAGMVGAHNALMTYGRRTGKFGLTRMKDAYDYEEVKKTYGDIVWPPVKIVLTGKGRVGTGAARVLTDMGIRKVAPMEFLNHSFSEPVFTQIDYQEYAFPKPETGRVISDFFNHPEDFESGFAPYSKAADILINGIFWNNKAPVFFTPADMKQEDFSIEVIADITCDIAPVASIPSTLRATTIADPVFGYDPVRECETEPFREGIIDMMTIDNLPNELPRDASTSFGEQFLDHIWPEVRSGRYDSGILQRGTIAADGQLGPRFGYLKGYAGL